MRSFHLSDKFLKDAKETENKIEKTDSFVPFAHYEGKEQIIDPSLYDEEKGIYQGEPHHALVWPDADSNDTTLIFNPARNSHSKSVNRKAKTCIKIFRKKMRSR